ncbi:hypothetical protein Ancab_021736, partial [Ancistrocladus abbreviatus]
LLVECKGFGYRVNCAACGAEFDLCHAGGARFPLDDEPRILIYRCLECDNQFHKECLDTPPIKRANRHLCNCDLNLHLKPFPENYEQKDYYCDECGEKRNIKAFSYVCTKCEFVSHIQCDLFENIEVKIERRLERETEEKILEYQKRLGEMKEKIESLEKELGEILCDKSSCEETIKKLRSRLKRKRDEIS